MKTTIKTRVKAGIAFLDAVKPNWKKKIDLDKLDLFSPYTCVIGEVYGGYFKGMKKLEIEWHSDSATALGFYEGSVMNYPSLTKVWKQELKKIL